MSHSKHTKALKILNNSAARHLIYSKEISLLLVSIPTTISLLIALFNKSEGETESVWETSVTQREDSAHTFIGRPFSFSFPIKLCWKMQTHSPLGLKASSEKNKTSAIFLKSSCSFFMMENWHFYGFKFNTDDVRLKQLKSLSHLEILKLWLIHIHIYQFDLFYISY